MDRKTKVLLTASVAGLLAAAGWAGQAQAQEEQQSAAAKVPCYGVNKCQGVGACGGKGHSCHGQNTCAGQGYLELEKDDCLKIQGGRLTEEPAA
jgi:uncharacterized membrane protein